MELNNNKVDAIVATLKATLGVVPYAGGILAEVIGNTIPNQRIDRIAKFLEILGKKLEGISQDVIQIQMQIPEIIDLFEDCIWATTRALTEERKEYIANVFANGIKDNEANIINHKKLLNILNQLDDIDLLQIKKFVIQDYGSVEYEDFYWKYKDVLEWIPGENEYKSTKEINDDEEKYKIHLRHLLRLGLIEIKEGAQTWDNLSGNDLTNTKCTWQAVMLLNEINQLPHDFPLQ